MGSIVLQQVIEILRIDKGLEQKHTFVVLQWQRQQLSPDISLMFAECQKYNKEETWKNLPFIPVRQFH